MNIIVNHLKNMPFVFMVKPVGYQVGYQKKKSDSGVLEVL
ncbi:hypothetical protein D029_0001 [Vibrio parahaemolyticus 970107]|nr:hypothetical protein D029_0001 [Vibrio parahaemolyticus 970107]